MTKLTWTETEDGLHHAQGQIGQYRMTPIVFSREDWVNWQVEKRDLPDEDWQTVSTFRARHNAELVCDLIEGG